MKKNNTVKLPPVNADKHAKNLKRALGEDRAFRLADSLVKNGASIGIGDVNSDIFSMKEIGKNVRFWTQVRNILGK